MTINELKNWMREQFEQGNGIVVATAGQGGSGIGYWKPEMAEWNLADVERYDDTEISIVEDEEEINNIKAMIDDYSTYPDEDCFIPDAFVRLKNDDGEIIYVFYQNGEEVENVELIKGATDTLSWSYMGKDYSCTGEFYVKNSYLFHTFIAPSGKEFEIVCDYE